MRSCCTSTCCALCCLGIVAEDVKSNWSSWTNWTSEGKEISYCLIDRVVQGVINSIPNFYKVNSFYKVSVFKHKLVFIVCLHSWDVRVRAHF